MSFALLALVFPFSFIAFVKLESIATSRLGFWGHIAVLGEKMRDKGLKCASIKSGSSLPKTDVGFELGPSAEGSDEYVNAGNFGYVVACGPEKFVVAYNVATEIAELVELRKGCGYGSLGGCDFVV